MIVCDSVITSQLQLYRIRKKSRENGFICETDISSSSFILLHSLVSDSEELHRMGSSRIQGLPMFCNDPRC